MNAVRLLRKYISMLFQSAMEYRASFWLTAAGHFIISFTSCISLLLMFERFGQLEGWTMWEVLLCTGAVQTAFPLAECFGRGFDTFRQLVRTGGLDTLLLRPRNIFLQIFGWRMDFTRIGRFLQGCFVMVLAVSHLPSLWSPAKLGVLALMVLSGAAIFTGVFILGAALCFWTVEGLEVVNILTYGGQEISKYPFDIYKKPYLVFFTGIIPYACSFYWPLLGLTGRSGSAWCILAPVLGLLFLIPACCIFKLGVRHYTSTGS